MCIKTSFSTLSKTAKPVKLFQVIKVCSLVKKLSLVIVTLPAFSSIKTLYTLSTSSVIRPSYALSATIKKSVFPSKC